MIRIVIKILKALSSDTSPASLALAICFGAIVGLTPLMSPHNLLFVFILLFFTIHLGTFILAFSGFSILAFILDPLFDSFGYYLLTHPSLGDFWTTVYNTAIGRLSFFNNTIVVGSLSLSLIACIPLYFLSQFLILKYRKVFEKWVKNSKLMVLLKSSSLFKAFAESRGAD